VPNEHALRLAFTLRLFKMLGERIAAQHPSVFSPEQNDKLRAVLRPRRQRYERAKPIHTASAA
jgi:hypothetical protein